LENNLERIIEERGMKKGWICRQLGINKNTLTNWISGSVPRLDQAYKIAKLLNKNIEDIWPSE